ncbi:MAG: hypothetical protein R3247_16860, partial [Rhodothermales bacterium]|nr:hypothetical protein [Rhodothermales bacterium]
ARDHFAGVGYPLRAAAPDTCVHALDLSRLQRDRREALYVDAVHYNAGMARLVAERIAAGIFFAGTPPVRPRRETGPGA